MNIISLGLSSFSYIMKNPMIIISIIGIILCGIIYYQHSVTTSLKNDLQQTKLIVQTQQNTIDYINSEIVRLNELNAKYNKTLSGIRSQSNKSKSEIDNYNLNDETKKVEEYSNNFMNGIFDEYNKIGK